MYGAILGDIIGSPYEFDRGDKTTQFPLFGRGCTFTDDTVMTIAVAEALMDGGDIAASMRSWGRRYPHAGYGSRFISWLFSDTMGPYNSYGNGSAMRVSAAGWLYPTLEQTLNAAEQTAVPTHDHPEGIKGAQATAAAIFLARNRASKDAIKTYISDTFGYDLDRTLAQIRPSFYHMESCQRTVPEAIIAFLEAGGFESTIRNAVSLGGDTDTLACIAGSIAEAFYGVPDDLAAECRARIPEEMLCVLDRFDAVKEARL